MEFLPLSCPPLLEVIESSAKAVPSLAICWPSPSNTACCFLLLCMYDLDYFQGCVVAEGIANPHSRLKRAPPMMIMSDFSALREKGPIDSR